MSLQVLDFAKNFCGKVVCMIPGVIRFGKVSDCLKLRVKEKVRSDGGSGERGGDERNEDEGRS